MGAQVVLPSGPHGVDHGMARPLAPQMTQVVQPRVGKREVQRLERFVADQEHGVVVAQRLLRSVKEFVIDG